MAGRRDEVLAQAFALRCTIRDLAAHLGVSHAAVSQWQRVPERHLVATSRWLGVPVWKLRPDLVKRPRRHRNGAGR